MFEKDLLAFIEKIEVQIYLALYNIMRFETSSTACLYDNGQLFS